MLEYEARTIIWKLLQPPLQKEKKKWGMQNRKVKLTVQNVTPDKQHYSR